MARFDVYRNPDPHDATRVPYFLDVQNDYIQNLQTRILVPLWRSYAVSTLVDALNHEFEVEGVRVIMDTPALGAVAISSLRSPVANLRAQQFAVQNALDALFGGY